MKNVARLSLPICLLLSLAEVGNGKDHISWDAARECVALFSNKRNPEKWLQSGKKRELRSICRFR